MMLDEQLRLMDLFSKEVLPLRVKSEKVQYSQMYMKIASLIPIFGFYYICYNCFSARYDENPSSESINMFMAVLYPLKYDILDPKTEEMCSFIWHSNDRLPDIHTSSDRSLNI
ncbi:unnamed protein product [Caenorhabditis brenneri]